MMKLLVFSAVVCSITICCEGFKPLKNYLSSQEYPCIQCLCHSVSGCWFRQNCARYSISKAYWMQAGSLVLDATDHPTSDASYRKCMRDENCIVGTIIEYTNQFGNLNCNCDDKFDCKDRLALHLFGDQCGQPNFGVKRARRFNECAAGVGAAPMLSKEGSSTCKIDIRF